MYNIIYIFIDNVMESTQQIPLEDGLAYKYCDNHILIQFVYIVYFCVFNNNKNKIFI